MRALALVAIVALAAPARGESESSAEVRRLVVTITDEKGGPVPGLSRDDVAVMEEGVAREVTELAPDTRPLTLTLLVDSSEPLGSLYRLHVVDAVAGFVRQLPEGTRYSIWTTGDRPTKQTEFIDDRAAAANVLKRVPPTGGNTLLDALVEAPRELAKEEGARTAVVVVTGYGIEFSNYDRRAVVDHGLKGGAVFYAVHFEDVRGDSEARQNYDYTLTTLAERSGGVHETTLSAMGLAGVLKGFAAQLAAQYRLAYATLPEAKSGKLQVSVARPGVKVRVARPKS
jgi:VWFA-related protein